MNLNFRFHSVVTYQ